MTEHTSDIVVVGSGPAGISATRALLAQGLAVTLVDTGRTMPPEADRQRAALAARDPEHWQASELEAFNEQSLRDRGSIPLKTVFGSDFPYSLGTGLHGSDATLLGSHARGGLSNVWGAAILPLSEADMRDWPLKPRDMAAHYEAVLEWMPHAQQHDSLADDYPLYSRHERPMHLSRQAQTLYEHWRERRDRLNAEGFRFGQARVAVSDCRYCGRCLHGCPWRLIYDSGQTLDELRGSPGLTYVGDTEVRAIEEQADAVLLHVTRGGQAETLRAGRVFLGAGTLHTNLLLMPLLGRTEILIRDSAYFIVPFLAHARTRGVTGERLYTLAQLFMEVDVPQASKRNLHLQWYSYNDLYSRELRRSLGALARLMPRFAERLLLERLWSIQAFLHSDDSPALRLSLRNAGREARIEAVPEPRSRALVAAALRRLAARHRDLGGHPIRIAMRAGLPGSSFHAGASLPMSTRGGPGRSDLLGRPEGLQRVHVIDSSVLPDIPPSTITLTVMANAHRIASEFRGHA